MITGLPTLASSGSSLAGCRIRRLGRTFPEMPAGQRGWLAGATRSDLDERAIQNRKGTNHAPSAIRRLGTVGRGVAIGQ